MTSTPAPMSPVLPYPQSPLVGIPPALAVLPELGIKKPGSIGATTEPGKVSADAKTNISTHQPTTCRERLLEIEACLEQVVLNLESGLLGPVSSGCVLADVSSALDGALRSVAVLICELRG